MKGQRLPLTYKIRMKLEEEGQLHLQPQEEDSAAATLHDGCATAEGSGDTTAT